MGKSARTQLEEEKKVLDSKIHELQQEVEALRKLPTEIEGLENEKNILEAKIKELEYLTKSSSAMTESGFFSTFLPNPSILSRLRR